MTQQEYTQKLNAAILEYDQGEKDRHAKIKKVWKGVVAMAILNIVLMPFICAI